MQIYTENAKSMHPRRSLFSVLAGKFTAWIEKNSAKRIFIAMLELFAGVFLAVATLAPGEVALAVETLLKTKDFALPKVCCILLLFFYRKPIIRKAKGWTRKKTVAAAEKLLDGIPVPELADYLIRNKHFKREGVNGVRETFGLSMENYNRLAQRLEDNGVLIRGSNNSRVLDGKWSRQALIEWLGGEERSEDLRPHFSIRRIGEGHKVRLMNSEMAVK